MEMHIRMKAAGDRFFKAMRRINRLNVLFDSMMSNFLCYGVIDEEYYRNEAEKICKIIKYQ